MASTYLVPKGDAPSLIAKKYGTTVEELQRLNPQYAQFTKDRNYIQAGWNLNVPDMPGAAPAAPITPAPATPTLPPKPIQAPPMQSFTGAGQEYLKVRQDANLPADELTIKKLYRDRGYEEKYGPWKGSETQYKAMWMQDIEDTKSQVTQKQGLLNEAQQKGYGLNDEINFDAGGGVSNFSGISTAPTKEFMTPTADDYNRMMDSILNTIGTTDLSKLIQDFAGGSMTTPELELSKEDKQAKLDDLKAAASQGLSKIQQSLATRGMSFSGIRTESEASFAAEVLAKEAGIGREFAGKIISAARQESERRESALKTAEANYNKALEAMGYVYNPITNSIQPTLAREKAGQPKTVNVGGNLFQYDPDTGSMTLLYEAPAKERNLNIHYEEDSKGNVTKIITDPTTGDTIRTEKMGKLGKGDSTTSSPTVKSGSMIVGEGTIAQGQAKLDASRGSDNYANTGIYLSALAKWKESGGLEQDFFTNYPPKNYLNPSDTSIPKYIKEKLKSETENKLDAILNKLQ